MKAATAMVIDEKETIDMNATAILEVDSLETAATKATIAQIATEGPTTHIKELLTVKG